MNSFQFQQSESSTVNRTPDKALILPFVAERIKTLWDLKRGINTCGRPKVLIKSYVWD